MITIICSVLGFVVMGVFFNTTGKGKEFKDRNMFEKFFTIFGTRFKSDIDSALANARTVENIKNECIQRIEAEGKSLREKLHISSNRDYNG